jgi:hypothetical protein
VWRAVARRNRSIQRLRADGLALEGDPHELLVTEQPWEEPIIENPAMIRLASTVALLCAALCALAPAAVLLWLVSQVSDLLDCGTRRVVPLDEGHERPPYSRPRSGAGRRRSQTTLLAGLPGPEGPHK